MTQIHIDKIMKNKTKKNNTIYMVIIHFLFRIQLFTLIYINITKNSLIIANIAKKHVYI